MKECPAEYIEFTSELLMPLACEVLRNFYSDHCEGREIGIEIKYDSTPASLADREAEKAMRKLILKAYPDHGIIGEEYGVEAIDSPWVWILDPLDGTKEFLKKKPGHFGCLIGLFYEGVPFMGAIGDPMNNKMWIGGKGHPTTLNGEPVGDVRERTLSGSRFHCTNYEGMFPVPAERKVIEGLISSGAEVVPDLNCLGFAGVAEGTMDFAVENNDALHDIAALIPVLEGAGARVCDIEGRSFIDRQFDLVKAVSRKFYIVASRHEHLVDEVVNRFKNKSEAA